MGQPRTVLRAFHGGVMAPEMFGRIDDAQFRNGAEVLQNLIAQLQGPAERRPGFRFVRAVSDSTKQVRMLPFVFSRSQAFAVEVGAGWFRWHTTVAGVTGTLQYDPTLLPVWINHAQFSSRAGDEITTVANHLFATGDPIQWYTSGVLPTPLFAGVRYFAIVTAVNKLKVASTAANALAGTAITLTADGSGTRQVAKVYDPGDLVKHTPVSTEFHYYCFKSTLGTAPTPAPTDTTYWYKQNAPNILEIPNTYTGGQLFDLNHDQSADVLTITSRATGAYELRRLGPQTWTWQPVSFAAPIAAPTGVAGTFKAGILWRIGAVVDTGNTALTFGEEVVLQTDTAHGLAVGDTFYLDEPSPVVPSFHYLKPDFYRVSAIPGGRLNQVQFSTVDGSQVHHGYQTVTFTAAPPGKVNWAAHGFLADQQVVFNTTGGSPPAAITQNVVYYVRNPALNDFEISATPGGSSINFATAGTGTTTGYSHNVPNDGGVFTAYAISITPTSVSSENSHNYKVTAIDGSGHESQPSAAVTVLGNLDVDGSVVTITWTAVAGAVRYRVYRELTGLYGFIGESDTTAFADDGIGPDLSVTPPLRDTSLDAAKPGCVGHFGGRRLFACIDASIQETWGTRSGTESDLSYHIPVQDDDRLRFKLTSSENAEILHIVPLAQLMLLTASSEVRVSPVNTDALTPTSIDSRPQSYIGTTTVRPHLVGPGLLFAGRDGHVYELGFNAVANGYTPADVAARAKHLFDAKTIVDSARSRAPTPIVWWVSSNGQLVAITYSPEQGIGGWHTHTTDGVFESCCVIPEGVEEHLWVVVRRTINGVQLRYVERMDDFIASDAAHQLYVDSGLTYSGAPVMSVTAPHLALKEVAILADGVVLDRQTATAGGLVQLTVPASVVSVGLPYESALKPLPPLMQLDGFGTGRARTVNRVWPRVICAGTFTVEPAGDASLAQTVSVDFAAAGATPTTLPGDWLVDAQFVIRQSNPIPMKIVSLTIEVAPGD